jgi:HD superfamily phosphodiesterase
MTIDAREQVERAFPAVDRIEDDELREGVIHAWETAVADAGIDDLASVPWLPPEQECLGLPDETLVEHVRDVVASSVAFVESLVETRGDRMALSMDVVLAGALVHDVSKLYEYASSGEAGESSETEVGRLLGHPHYGVHVAAAAGLPAEVKHVVLAHSPRSAVEPATMEAEIVTRVDRVAAAAIRARAVDDRRDA